MEQEWNKVNIRSLRLNGLKLQAAIDKKEDPYSSAPKLLDSILAKNGISNLTEAELQQKSKELGVIVE